MTEAELRLEVERLINEQLKNFWAKNPEHRVPLHLPDAAANMAEQFCDWAANNLYDLANNLAGRDFS